MKTTRVPVRLCPKCGHILDAATATHLNPQASPEPGDATICVACRAFLIFGPDMTPRPATAAELREIRAALEARP